MSRTSTHVDGRRARWGLCAMLALTVFTANANAAPTTTPIKHVVVIFQENVSFDHYFATYPHAANPEGEPRFEPRPGTPTVNGLDHTLLTQNPNSANPQRLDRIQPLTCDQDHGYTAEQRAFDGGLMDAFVENTENASCSTPDIGMPGLVMDYYDGNTVTAIWHYAQYYAMSDNSFGTTFGPSTPGALNLVAGQTGGAEPTYIAGHVTNGVVINDLDPTYDDCSHGATAALTTPNVGEALTAADITWGWFEGGFRPTGTVNGKAYCGATHENIGGAIVSDYIPHHEPFQYYASTANPHHLPPSAPYLIGTNGDQANHQYDLQDFWTAVESGHMPAVSFLKAPGYEDGHAGYSDPLDEQRFLVETINHLERTPDWSSTAVIISYDDSDGWYDHVMGPIVSQSQDSVYDALVNGSCGTKGDAGTQDRCGYGPRLPLMVISPYARANFVDHSVTDQSSILRFIEDNWNLGRLGDESFDAKAGSLEGMFNFHHPRGGRLFLDPDTGEIVGGDTN